MGINLIIALLALSFGIRAWTLTSILVLFELGWVLLASFTALWSFCIEDVSLLFIGITLLFISTVELALGVTIFVLLNSEQGNVYLTA